jgi:hypothetical protein
MFYKQHKNFLSKNDKKFIENIILDKMFPFYHYPHSCINDNKSFLIHIILRRPEDRKQGENYNSDFAPAILNILNSFFKKAKIKPKELLRIAVNYTYPNGQEKCDLHTDHNDIPYKQVIIYLNDCLDKESKTVILDKNKVVKSISPEKYKGIAFGNNPHYHYYPKVGFRIVLICTYI